MPENSVTVQDADESAVPGERPASPPPPNMISVDQLAAHPGNVRTDLDLSAEFCASIAETGVRIPLLVTCAEGDGGYQVIEGHRRLAAALKTGLPEVPCVIDPGRADDQAGQYLDMVVANSDRQRRNFTPAEEVAALFAAHEAGASRTRIRRATGRKAEEIKTALQAGRMSAGTREQMAEVASQLTLDQLAILAEFDADQDAVAKGVDAFRNGYTAEYVAERIRQDRAEAAEHERLCAELEAAGTPVTSEIPEGAVRIGSLTHDGEDRTAETHATCPGRGVYFPPWNRLHAVHYCTSPGEHGHAVRGVLLRRQAEADVGTVAPAALPDPPADEPPDPDRRLVIEGNKAWKAASEVRKRWLATVLFARRTAPRETAPFVARQLLTMPDPLRSGLAAAPSRLLFSEITGRSAVSWREICDTTAAARLPLLMLGPIVTAYEQAMTEGEGRNTWRTDRYSPCPRRDAGQYLAFLACAGYQLAVIEQALADGVPYTGDTPAAPDLTGTDSDGPTAEGPDRADGQDGAPPEAA
jgi:ParB family chromosome partitioning protein